MTDWMLCRDKLDATSIYHRIEEHAFAWSGFGEPRPVVRFYRRPLAAMLNPLTEAGLALDAVLEPLPTEEFRRADPERHATLVVRPDFLCVRARKH